MRQCVIKSRMLLCSLISLTALVCSQTEAQVMPNLSAHKSVGTVNCASSTCHGSIAERSSTSVLQNEYTTWLRQDPHTQAYAVLNNAQSKRIAKNLNLPQPASQSKVCLDCHSHNPAPSLRGERFDATEGVGCEACHGPAEKWIKTHVEPNATHARNVAAGLYPTDNPKAVATLCASCHVGDASRPITHQIMGAGHPRISLEVDTFMALEPPHWRIDADWTKRKGAYDEGKIWAMGQIANSLNLLDIIATPSRNMQGIMPELMMFDCHACHTSMHKTDWTPGMGTKPGMARINDSSLLMVRAVAQGTAPALQARFDAQLTALHAISTSPSANMAQLALAAAELKATVTGIQAKAGETAFNAPVLQRILKTVINQAGLNSYTDYADAEQVYMSMSSLSNSLARQGGAVPAGVNQSLGTMLKMLAKDDEYDRQAFETEMLKLKNAAGAL